MQEFEVDLVESGNAQQQTNSSSSKLLHGEVRCLEIVS